ncbi:hypothetical protein HMPREF1317_1185 [Schaalia georgiae F0490]|uniref:Uncharacterized protein n=1 Tax=Schaalia georgiae F0490 TaxID=1125717 RepID=J1HP23_9ACTO|nr:hypothetical protein HMPREF1317_1185 [Schaalia georgiae F0490]
MRPLGAVVDARIVSRPGAAIPWAGRAGAVGGVENGGNIV